MAKTVEIFCVHSSAVYAALWPLRDGPPMGGGRVTMTRVGTKPDHIDQKQCFRALQDCGVEVRVPDVTTLSVQRSQLRKRVLEAQQRKPRRYGPELKEAIIHYGLARRAEGASNRVIAGELGLSVAVVASWLRHGERRKKGGKPLFKRLRPALDSHAAHDRDDPDGPDPAKQQ